MTKLSCFLCKCSLFVLVPVAANAAGTYYTGGYQSPQTARYQSSAFSGTANNMVRSTSGVSSYNQARYNSAGYNTAGYSAYANRAAAQNARTAPQTRSQQPQNSAATRSGVSSGGLRVDAGLNYKTGMWQFDMNNAGSKLHYDNLSWGVFDVNAGYDFNLGNTVLTVDAGLEYGVQLGESTMIDDDISNGGYGVAFWPSNSLDADDYEQRSNALSIGASKSGDMLGLRAGVGLKDFFTVGRVKITPSVGWRYLKYKLETSENYGMVVDTLTGMDSCSSLDGMTQCWPAVGFFKAVPGDTVVDSVTGETSTGPDVLKYYFTPYVGVDLDHIKDPETGLYYAEAVGVPLDWNGVQDYYIDTMGTFYFNQRDVSHSYDVTWSGPYLALDMLYDINVDNSVSARVELGLPMYNAIADQPYRPDWQHPKSIEDKGEIGSALHLGMGAQWRTAITDKVSLSVGVTYDYYNVSGADATTYLDPAYWEATYQGIWNSYYYDSRFEFAGDWQASADAMLNGFIGPGYDKDGNKIVDEETGETLMFEYSPDYTAVYIQDVKSKGWKDTVKDEIDSFFKSLGVRVGLNIRF